MTSLVTVGTRKNAREDISVENVKTLTTAQTPVSARKWHPKRCNKYESGNCRFGNDCAYKHQKPTKKQDHEDLKVKLEQVEKLLHAMTRKVLSLEEEVKNKSITDDIIKDLKKKVSELCEEKETEKPKQQVDNSFDFNHDDIKVSSSTPKDKKDKVEKD